MSLYVSEWIGGYDFFLDIADYCDGGTLPFQIGYGRMPASSLYT